MYPKQLLQCLHEAGATVRRDGSDLILSTGASALPEYLIQEVRESKQALLAYLDMLVAPHFIRPQRDEWAIPNRCPASPAQRQLWLAHQSSDNAATYNLASALRIRGTFDVLRLEQAVNRVVARHEVLRTSFHEEGNGLLQYLTPQVHIPINCTLIDGDAQTSSVQSHLLSWAAQEFDLSRAPLLRVNVLALAPDEHIVSVIVHHIVFDAWSAQTFFREVILSYQNVGNIQDYEENSPTLQFSDYAYWLQQNRNLGQEQEQRAFWSRVLAQAPTVTTLPYDFPLVKHPTSEGAAVDLTFTPELSAAVANFAATHNTTLFNVAATALTALIARYTSQDDVCIGVPVSTRNRPELLSLIGFLVNTAVLRVAIRPDLPFSALLKACDQAMLDIRANIDLPFEDVIQEVKPERGGLHSPLFQVMLSVLQSADLDVKSDDLRFELIEPRTENVKYDLVLNLREHHGMLKCRLEYRTQLFETATATRFLANFENLLGHAITAANCPLDQLEYVTPSELALQLTTWNANEIAVPDECIHAQFERQAVATPDAIAIRSDTRSYRYAELNGRANQLAYELLERGLNPDDRVMICMPRSADQIALVLAVVKAGGVFVPVDPAEPVERFRHMRDSLQPFLLVVANTATYEQGQLPGAVSFDVLAQRASRHAQQNPAVNIQGGHSAYIMFTSGSTGVPKGATIRHRGLINRFRWQVRVHGYTQSDVFVQKSPMTFDTAIWEIFIPLSIGAQLIVAAHEGHRDPEYLAALISRHRITVIDFVPSMLAVFLTYCGVQGESIRSLRHIILGGESLPLHLLQELTRLSSARIYNQYGPTETSIGVTAWIGHANARQVTIGRPIDNTRIYILDKAMHVLPIGAVGELYIGGTPVGSGYFGRDDLTKNAFLINPFVDGDMLYRTGDLARYLPNGEIDYRGRADRQVKIRGMRVELGEVARALLDHQYVREALATLTEAAGQAELSIYYVVSDRVSVPQLRQHLKQRLPRHMLPIHYVELEAFPLNRNGKVDEKVLPAPMRTASIGARPFVSQTQHALALIWHSLLAVLPSGLDDDFFELGGHSLMAAQLIPRVRTELRADLALRDVFEASTVESMSERIEQKRHQLEAFEI